MSQKGKAKRDWHLLLTSDFYTHKHIHVHSFYILSSSPKILTRVPRTAGDNRVSAIRNQHVFASSRTLHIKPATRELLHLRALPALGPSRKTLNTQPLPGSHAHTCPTLSPVSHRKKNPESNMYLKMTLCRAKA